MPQRFLRPALTNSTRWNSVSWKAQSLWIRLLTLVDDFGRYDGRPSVICGHAFSVWNEQHPEDVVNPQETAALCCELSSSGLAEFYDSEGKRIVQLLQWQERARSEKSKWPERSTIKQETAAESCGILRNPASLVPRPSPSPTPSPSGCAVELPESFPNTEQEAVSMLMGSVPEGFIRTTWNLAMSRNGTDSKGVQIKSWVHYVKFMFEADRSRTNEINSRNHKQRSRNDGTLNAGCEGLYSIENVKRSKGEIS